MVRIGYWKLSFWVLLLFSQLGYSQNNQALDRVFLNSGSIISGTIVEMDEEKVVVLSHQTEMRISIPFDMMEKYHIGVPMYPLRRDPVFTDREKSTYFFVNYGILGKGNDGDSDFGGFGSQSTQPWFAEFGVGYFFTQRFGVGISLGKTVFDSEKREMAYPLSVEVKGFFSRHIFSPYYRLSGGWTFPRIFLLEPKDQIRDSGRGWFVKPALGLSWQVFRNFDVHLELGNYIGYATFYSFGRWGALYRDEIKLRRWSLSFGASYSIFGK